MPLRRPDSRSDLTRITPLALALAARTTLPSKVYEARAWPLTVGKTRYLTPLNTALSRCTVGRPDGAALSRRNRVLSVFMALAGTVKTAFTVRLAPEVEVIKAVTECLPGLSLLVTNGLAPLAPVP